MVRASETATHQSRPRPSTGQATGETLPQFNPTIIELCGPGTGVGAPATHECQHARGVLGLDRHDRSRLRRSPHVRDGRGGERADTGRREHDARMRDARIRERVFDLEEDRRVALHHPARRFGVAGPRGVGDHESAIAARGRRARHRIVVRAVDDLDLGAFALDARDACRDHVVGHEDARVEPEEPRHRRDRAAVIAVGGGQQRERMQRRELFGELGHRRPRRARSRAGRRAPGTSPTTHRAS